MQLSIFLFINGFFFIFFKAWASKQQNAYDSKEIFLIDTKVTSSLLGLLWKVNGDFV